MKAKTSPSPVWDTSEILNAFKAAVEEDIADSKSKGLPIARYDAGSHKAYLEYTDGTREYVD